MSRFKSVFVIILMVIIFLGCKNEKRPDVSQINLKVEPQFFYQDLFELDTMNMENGVSGLMAKYGTYLDAYSQKIIKIGKPGNPNYEEYLKQFLNYEDNRDVYDSCQKVIPAYFELNTEMTDAFQHYKYYFPQADIPVVYFHTSYFNQSIAMDSSWISISVEKYLGADCIFYEWLGVHQYLRRKMVPEKIVPDLMKAMAMGNINLTMQKEDVINKMLEQGKLAYFVKHMMPNIKNTLLFDFSPEQMDWCEHYEADMWSRMVENKHIYNTERMIIKKYIGDSPFTYHFGKDSPGKAAIYLAYKIIQAYADHHPEIKLEQLMKESDGHKILREARYRP